MNRSITVLFTSGEPTSKVRAELEEHGYQILIGQESSPMDMDLSSVEVLVCYNPFAHLDFDKLPSLKWIHLVSKGMNHVPVEDVQKRGILVTNTLQSTSIPISEWIITQILCLYKQSSYFIKNQQQHLYQAHNHILELFHKKILFLGTGFIAKEAARRLSAFDTIIDGINSSGHQAGDCFRQCFSLAELKDRIGEYDIVISTIPATESTYHILNEEVLSKLPEHAIVVNVSRGTVIDTPALVSLLQNHKLHGAALDVFEQEPLPADSPLWDVENLLITPHNSYLSENYKERNFKEALDNLLLYSEDRPLQNLVNFSRGY